MNFLKKYLWVFSSLITSGITSGVFLCYGNILPFMTHNHVANTPTPAASNGMAPMTEKFLNEEFMNHPGNFGKHEVQKDR